MTTNSAQVTIFYSFDTFDETIPLKQHSSDVDNLFISLKEQLEKYRNLQSDLGDKEKNNFISIESLDRKIYSMTVIEIFAIVVAFGIEIIVLKLYLRNKELI